MAHLLYSVARRPLLIHMDVNRTIVMVDPAGQKTIHDILNTNVAAVVHGIANVVNDAKAGPDAWKKTWKAIPPGDRRFRYPSLASALEATASCTAHVPKEPTSTTGGNEAANGGASCVVFNGLEFPRVMSYDNYVDLVLHPEPAHMRGLGVKEAEQLWKQVSKARRQDKAVFTEAGQPGETFRTLLDEQVRGMTRPRLTGSSRGSAEEPLWFIIPAFHELLSVLSELEWPVTIAFRTFGSDMPEIRVAFLDWLLERDPSLPKPRGPLLKALRQDVEQRLQAAGKSATDTMTAAEWDAWFPVAEIYRNAQGMYVNWKGFPVRVPPPASGPPPPVAPTAEDFEEAGGVMDEVQFLAQLFLRSGLISAEASTSPLLQPKLSVMGVRDYYPWWASHSERGIAGKVFPVVVPTVEPPSAMAPLYRSSSNVFATDGAETGASIAPTTATAAVESISQVFYDDNIRFSSERNIIDLRTVDAAELTATISASVAGGSHAPIASVAAGGEDALRRQPSSQTAVVQERTLQEAFLIDVDPIYTINDSLYMVRMLVDRLQKQDAIKYPHYHTA